ncbi:hypothetical protein NG99_20220 [Erwinia typographi]|uniref:diguanylate cyclase n=1 Tax=Erwinia typographi TaxID=371042 RepID=A0A0A3YUG7_9GAMM|nr:EAL domain-containing protein [Erwinia typographi]KGT89154.1 hypothetical protein NG99_20220 [Erwinia typographi]
MTNEHGLGLRRHFIRNVLTPMIAVVLITFLACGFTAWWVTTQSNAKALEKQQQVIENIFSQHLADYLQQHKNLLGWPGLLAQLSAGNPFGYWLNTLVGDDEVYLLDANNQPLSAWQAGKPIAPVSYFDVQRQLAPWVAELGHLSRSADFAAFTGDVARINGRVAEIALGEVPENRGNKLIFIRYLHYSFLDFLEHRGVVSAFRFVPSVPDQANSAGFLLRSHLNIPVSYVSWQPMRPGSQMLMVTAPLVLLAMLVITLMCIKMTRRLWFSSLSLSQSMAKLETSEAHAQKLAMQDLLTGLPNRTAMRDQLMQRLDSPPTEGESLALLLLDLDRFKMVNDTYGHHTGDELLIEVARRLKALLRPEDIVGRLGGDEFIVLLNPLHNVQQITQLCQQIISQLTAPITLQGNRMWIGVSIGVALSPLHGTERQELMRKADIALYAAKSEGRGRYQMYVPVLGEALIKRQQLAEALRLALETAQGLALWYQPIMDISGTKMRGIEALLRWQHPTLGPVSPADFIPVAEETGLIIPLGDWVLQQACGMAKNCPHLRMSVNVSPLQFLAGNFIERLREIVQQAGVDPKQIELEITEGVMLEDHQQALRTIQTLRSAGFRIALDDFGTGYSSLNYLTQFPVDTLKIDRSFIQLLGIQEQADTIVSSVIKLGHSLGLSVTAEGVETEQQRQALSAAGCDKLQGFLLSRPQPAEVLFAGHAV